MRRFVILALIIFTLAAGAFWFLRKNEQSKTKIIETPVITKVTLTKDGFEPSSITIKKGETVMWINESGKGGSVNSDPHPNHNLFQFLNLGEFPTSYTVQTIFPDKGSFGYHNHLNPKQKGTVIVE